MAGEAGCAYPSVQVNKSINAETAEELPEDVLTFFEDYTTLEGKLVELGTHDRGRAGGRSAAGMAQDNQHRDYSENN